MSSRSRLDSLAGPLLSWAIAVTVLAFGLGLALFNYCTGDIRTALDTLR
jgi:hypothetical protein